MAEEAFAEGARPKDKPSINTCETLYTYIGRREGKDKNLLQKHNCNNNAEHDNTLILVIVDHVNVLVVHQHGGVLLALELLLGCLMIVGLDGFANSESTGLPIN